MRFLSQGDFNFPFEWITYWVKHFFIWSFQSGTPNPDGLIRLPGRILNFLSFGLFGNVGASYFYLISTLVVAFVAFYFFAKNFLHIKEKSILLIGSLFFAFNPIFLGNLAKVGLVLAAAMLPLCLLAIQAGFERKQFRYFLLWILCLNLSFLHPYTFSVNVVVSGGYLLYMAWKHKAFVIDNLYKFVLVAIFGVMANLYFALPMATMGTVSKDIISTNVTPSPVDYTALVGISNTGDFFTGFSLSKNVFKDFEFYNATYQTIYFFGVFVFYVILLGLYLKVERHMKLSDKKRLGVLFASFLVLIALAATTVFNIDSLIKFLISMPGGWAFRSPLKWQLYIPLALYGILVLLLAQISSKRRLALIHTGLLGTFVLMNCYLVYDVYRKILVPRTLQNFAALYDMDMTKKTVLFVNNGECMDYMRANPRVVTEFNQVFTSKDTQLKHVLLDNVNAVNLGSYDYIMGCKTRLSDVIGNYDFAPVKSFADNSFHLYANEQPMPHITTPTSIFAIDDAQNIGNKYDFATGQLGEQFAFDTPRSDAYPATHLKDILEDITPRDIHNRQITTTLKPHENDGERTLHIRPGDDPLYYRLQGSTLQFSSEDKPELKQLPEGDRAAIPLPSDVDINVRYSDSNFSYKNILPNPSFEEGLWQKHVTDCYAYDDKPAISMSLNAKDSTKGKQSMELRAKQHIACSGPDRIAVKPGEHYLLSFDYQSLEGKYAGFYVGFDNPDETVIIERMQEEGKGWHSFSKEITVPEDAESMRLMLYAYPQSYGEFRTTVRYDNTSLIKIPPAQDRFYLTTEPATTIDPPQSMKFEVPTPTRKLVHIKGAKHPFYLATADSYNPLWRLEMDGTRDKSWWPNSKGLEITSKNHIHMNNTMNAWYVDPAKLCQQAGNCKQNSDGSYDFAMVMEFVPQRWFYVGALVSGTAILSGIAYYIWSARRGRKEGEGWRWR